MSYLITHSLLSAWLYAMADNPYEDATSERDYMEEFMKVLRREPTETTEAMQKGIDFEDLVTAIVNGEEVNTESLWYEAAEKVAQIVGGGVLQYKASKNIEVDGLPIVLYGRLDCLKAGKIYDIKFSGSYERGKFLNSTQHPTYLEIIPEAYEFTYVISNGKEVWEETYDRDNTKSIYPIISDFIQWLKRYDLMSIYQDKWCSK